MFMDFPGGPVVKNPPANAGDTGSVSSSTEPTRHNYWARALQQEKSLKWEACELQPESSPHSTQPQKARTLQWRPVQPKRSVRNQSQNLVLCKGQLNRQISD